MLMIMQFFFLASNALDKYVLCPLSGNSVQTLRIFWNDGYDYFTLLQIAILLDSLVKPIVL